MKPLFTLLAAVAALFCAPALADPEIRVTGAWARATPPNAATAAVYLTVWNGGDRLDRLTGASTALAAEAKLHGHAEEAGVLRMRPLAAVEVAPGDSAVLEPGGRHIMLFGLKQQLETGSTVPLTLHFESTGPVEVRAQVLPITSRGPEPHDHGHR